MHQIFSIAAISDSPEPKHLQSLNLGFVRSPTLSVRGSKVTRTLYTKQLIPESPCCLHLYNQYYLWSDNLYSRCPWKFQYVSISIIYWFWSFPLENVPFNRMWRIYTGNTNAHGWKRAVAPLHIFWNVCNKWGHRAIWWVRRCRCTGQTHESSQASFQFLQYFFLNPEFLYLLNICCWNA